MSLEGQLHAGGMGAGGRGADARGDGGDGGGARRALGRGQGERGGGGALGKAKAAGGGDALIDEIVAAYETSEGRDLARGVLKAEARGKAPAAIVDAAVSELGAVAALVAARRPGGAERSGSG